ncbi:MAG: hypothetical protein QNJ54_24810 [Prochloraceae cyanobacterium]|nr:hypothetical protein [Prochloraceae cyanobacterium]
MSEANIPLSNQQQAEVYQDKIGNKDRDSDRQEDRKEPLEKITLTQQTSDRDTKNNNIDWCAQAHKLRQRNRELLKTVVKLEQTIADSQEKLQSQVLRTRSTDNIVAQQTEQLNASQEQIESLNRELEAARQTAQRQQILIETLSKQLEASQEQVAQLERECALLQEDYNQQTQKVSETREQIHELHSRLQRQQRYTLQYKAALDRYLEVPSPASLLIPKAQPIQPWSAQLNDEPNHSPSSQAPSNTKSSVVEIAEPTIEDSQTLEEQNDAVKEVVLPKFSDSKYREQLDQNKSSDRPIIPSESEVSNSASPPAEPARKSKKRQPDTDITLPKFIRRSS